MSGCMIDVEVLYGFGFYLTGFGGWMRWFVDL